MEKEELSDRIQSFVRNFLDYYSDNPDQFRHESYIVYKWLDSGGVNKIPIYFPDVAKWLDEGISILGFEELIQNLIRNEKFKLISSKKSAVFSLNRLIREVQIQRVREDKTLDRLLEEFVQKISKKGKLDAISVIQGLNFGGTSLEISQRSLIRKITEREKEVILNQEGLRSQSLKHFLINQNPVYGLVIKSGNKIVENLEDRRDFLFKFDDQKTSKEKENIELSLRLIQEKEFAMNNICYIDKSLWPLSHFSSRKTYETSSISINKGKISQSQYTELSNIYNTVASINKEEIDEGLRVAIERLKSSYEKINNRDVLVDCMIGIEALLSKGRDSFSKVRERASILLNNPDYYEELDGLYEKRCSIVHGGRKKVEKEEMEKSRRFLRRLTLKVIKIGKKEGVSSDEIAKKIDEKIREDTPNPFE